ncbi:heptaprenyl diphosphate synthase [Sporobacter termitidis DSM 10068]|uniref:Heptaprenyl diphosphate synthase n=1 Tax=Sporobacter termitidis DSM 10068 TaxID=1123282 RepID=A0A1M5Z030_9FIRM|nr:polyprenyl synthetase family protein [Sporobacter termitidis]SHI17627.1 heptaprenyl diphosphate synthase [Sporobacter termitidis DSM 10068]
MTKTELPEKVPLDQSLDLVRALLKQTLLESDTLMTEITAYLTESEGKNFRAMLLLTSSADAEGFVPRNALIAAAAIELLHLASLVHDDVIDDAETRRGRPSVKQMFGNKPAVICGDYLFCKCFLLVADISREYQDKFTDMARAMTKICLGELREYRQSGNAALSVREYFKIVAGKTSALFALSLYTGALIGGYDEAEARRASRFGHYIGMVFQLTDDCIDYQTESAVAGKTVQHDLAEGTVTLPLIFAMMKEPALRETVAKGLAPSAVRRVVSDVVNLGGVTMTMDLAQKYCRKAQKLLDAMLVGIRRSRLALLLDQIRTRVY